MRIEVLYLGCGEQQVIGELAEAVDGRLFFEYDAEWLSRGIELSPVYLPITTRGSVTTPTPHVGPLFGLFSDSLPDWWGEQMMKSYFGDKGIPWNKVTALQKLACAGAHAMGALAYQPPMSGGDFREELTVEVAELVSNAHSFIHGETAEMLPGLIRSGLSPGGAQPKVLLGFNHDFSKAVAGGGSLPEGYDRWLLKFDLDPEYELGREEYAYSQMARAAGINMAETQLLETGEGTCHFLSKRFDRPGNSRRHIHTYSGLTHTLVRDGLEYGDLMDLTRVLTGSEKEVEEIFRRACFNVLAGNDDDHGKNHAFLMKKDGQWEVSPAYDLTRTSNPLVSGMRAASVNGKSVNVGRLDLKRLGESQSVRNIDLVIDQVLDAIKDWPRWAAEAGLSPHSTEQIREEMPGSEM
ncbi:type II toxin-antitoxin system HipA family toxin [Verrucomicrobiaceae bacterium 5K15]|uniref:Type II toxin-antitoxin system HipA family toxin n=1 Tax=Oceaniferula flava TaxID=2800421 RepID=A0AAE2SF35_9BACT|nr:type II toxin-antitoxin system HipA family toxin [Oceaniferula flavus]MBK1855759.1 type II toxin-antitoxin system HipA family toxin [Oceaniferula flavus]MBM1137066.1 type II toxin-antitoxin system HipA family toxin [Oceaniferula flavus]